MANTYVPLLAPSQAPPELLAALDLPQDPEQRALALEGRRRLAFALLQSQENNLMAAAEWALARGEEGAGRLVKAMDPYLDLRALWHKQEELYGMATRWAENAGDQQEALGIYRPFFEKFPDAFRRNVLVVLNGLRQVCLALGLTDRAAWCTGKMERVAGGESGGTQGDGT